MQVKYANVSWCGVVLRPVCYCDLVACGLFSYVKCVDGTSPEPGSCHHHQVLLSLSLWKVAHISDRSSWPQGQYRMG